MANVALNVVLLRHYNFTAAGFATAVTELLFLVRRRDRFPCGYRAKRDRRGVRCLYLAAGWVMAAILHFAHGGGAAFRVIGWHCAGTVVGRRDPALAAGAPLSRGDGQRIRPCSRPQLPPCPLGEMHEQSRSHRAGAERDRRIARAGASEEVAKQLRAYLKNRSNLVVAKAAKIVGELSCRSLVAGFGCGFRSHVGQSCEARQALRRHHRDRQRAI